MAFASLLSRPSASPLHPRRGAAAVLRRAARAALARAKEIYPDLLVLGALGVMLAAMVALRVLIWLPWFHVKP